MPLSSPLASSGDRSLPRRPWPPPNEEGDELRTRRFDLPVGWGGRLPPLLLEGVSGGRSKEEEEEEGGGVVDKDKSVGPEEAETAEDGGRPRGLRRDFSAAATIAATASSPLCLFRLSGVIEGEVVLGGNDVDAPKPPPPPMIKDVLSFFGVNIPAKKIRHQFTSIVSNKKMRRILVSS